MIFAEGGLWVLMTLSLASLIGVNVLRRRRMHALAGIVDKEQLRFVSEDVRTLPHGLLKTSPFCEGHDFRIEHSASGQREGKRLGMIDLCFERGSSVPSWREYYALLGVRQGLDGEATLKCNIEGEWKSAGDADRIATLQSVAERFLGYPQRSGSGVILCEGWIWIYGMHGRREIPEWVRLESPRKLIAAIRNATANADL